METQEPKMPECFETRRLTLRCYRPEDGAAFYAFAQNNAEHLLRYEADNALRTVASVEEGVKLASKFQSDWRAGQVYFVGIFDKESGAYFGQIYVGIMSRELPEYVIGYVVDRACEGRGYVSEASRAVLDVLFNQMGAHRVRLEASEDNLRSRRVAERCGFTLEGHLRENHRNPDGSYRGDVFYGLLDREFRAQLEN